MYGTLSFNPCCSSVSLNEWMGELVVKPGARSQLCDVCPAVVPALVCSCRGGCAPPKVLGRTQ